MLHWYTEDNIYSVVSNQIGGRAGLFATGGNGAAVGLAAWRNPDPQDDGWGIGRGIQEVPLVCSLVCQQKQSPNIHRQLQKRRLNNS